MEKKIQKKKIKKTGEIPPVQRASAFIARRLLDNGYNGTATGDLLEALALIVDARLLPDHLADKCSDIYEGIAERKNSLLNGYSEKSRTVVEAELSTASTFDAEWKVFENAYKFGLVIPDDQLGPRRTQLVEIFGLREEIFDFINKIEEELLPDLSPHMIHVGKSSAA